jgi:intracellular multiplication protein IcmK
MQESDLTPAQSAAVADFFKGNTQEVPPEVVEQAIMAIRVPENTTAHTPAKTISAKLPSRSDMAFRSLLENALPLSPTQIEELHRLYDLTQQAAAHPPTPPPTPTSSSLVVN